MNNIRISVNLAKVPGSRVISFKTESGKTEQFVAIPTKSLYIPSEKPEPFLMMTMIHCPKSTFNDFMLKPYLASADYKLLSKEQQQQIPVIGSGTFMQEQVNKEFAQQAVAVVPEATSLQPTPSTEPTHAPAATQPSYSSSVGDEKGAVNPLKDDFAVYDGNQWTGPFDSFDAAVAFAEQDPLNRTSIECWQGNNRRGRWDYNAAMLNWIQAPNS